MTHRLITIGDCRIEDNTGRQVAAPALGLVMLAYICDAGRPVARRDIARLFWPDRPDAAAANLRSLIRRLCLAAPVLEQGLVGGNPATLSIDPAVLRCDLEDMDAAAPSERLRLASDAVARQFMPAAGAGKTALDGWVRDVRLRIAAGLRDTFLTMRNTDLADTARADLKRAAVLLLELDAFDDEVRSFLAPGRSVPARAATVDPANPASAHSGADWFDPAIADVAPPRLALLPPETASQAHASGSTANALIEDLTIGLCSNSTVTVVAPYTAERIRGSKDKAALLQKHNVMFALDTKRTDDKLFAQLILLPTDQVIWASRFELTPGNFTELGATIADAIQHAIVARISSNTELVQDFQSRPEAYFSYLRGLQSLSKLTLPSLRRARRHFKEALGHERGFAPALAGVSRTMSMEWVLTARGERDLLIEAEGLARAALEQNSNFAGGFKELGVSQLYLGNIDESLEALDRASTISPHYADALWSHADSLVHGSDPHAALEKVTAAIELNPISPDTYYWTAAGACFWIRDFARSIAYIRKMQDGRPASRLEAACWAMLDEPVKARACRNRVLKDNPDFDLERWLAMLPHRESWQAELYREGLIKAGF